MHKPWVAGESRKWECISRGADTGESEDMQQRNLDFTLGAFTRSCSTCIFGHVQRLLDNCAYVSDSTPEKVALFRVTFRSARPSMCLDKYVDKLGSYCVIISDARAESYRLNLSKQIR